MKIKIEKEHDQWVAEIVHIDENMHWIQQQRIKNQIHQWVRTTCVDYVIVDWKFYFKTKEDLEWFILRWS